MAARTNGFHRIEATIYIECPFAMAKEPARRCHLQYPHTTMHCTAIRDGRWRVFEGTDGKGQIWFRDNELGDPMPGPGETFAIPTGNHK